MEADEGLMETPRHYCTYFDSRYLTRGVALYDSLRQHSSRQICLWVLCLDEESHKILDRASLPGVRLIRMDDLERADPEFACTKTNRSLVEYFFTSTPCLLHHILNQNPEIADISYVDGDLYFFSDPERIFSEIGSNSIAITPHRFAKRNRDCEKLGIYNVAFNFFRRDADGIGCLSWWREKCIEWCYDRWEDGRFADQGYLNDWPERFHGVKVLDHPGINLAPWNVEDAPLTRHRKHIFADGAPLIFYHFHALKPLSRRLFNPCWENYEIKPSRLLRHGIYQPYIEHCRKVSSRLDNVQPQQAPLRDFPPKWLRNRSMLGIALEVFNGRLLFARGLG
jgi:hypothetical protein